MKRIGITLIFIIYFGLAIHFFLTSVNIPYIGIKVSFENSEWVVSNVFQRGLAERWEITRGDKIVSINGHPPYEHHTLKSYAQIEQINSLTVEKEGEVFLYQVEEHWSDNQFFWQAFFPGLFFILSCILALFTISKDQSAKTLVLALFMLTLGISLLSGMASARADLLARVVTGFVIISIPALFLHYIYLFFQSFNINLLAQVKLLYLYGLNGIIFLVQLMFIFGESGQAYFYSNYLLLGNFIILLSYGVFILIRNFIVYRNTVYASLFKVLIFGIILTFSPFIVLHGLSFILIGKALVSSTYTSLFFLFLPVTLFYLLVSNRLLDVDFILNRFRYYALFGLCPAALLLLLTDYILDISLDTRENIVLFLAFYLFFILVFYVKEYVDDRFRYVLFPKTNNIQSNLMRLIHSFSKVMKRAELEQTVIHEMKQILSVESIYFFRVSKIDLSVDFFEQSVGVDVNLLTESLHKSKDRLITGEVLFLPEGLSLVLAEREEHVDLLWIGNKRNRTNWNTDERLLLKTLAHYVALIYENLLLIEKLSHDLEKELQKENNHVPWMKRLLFSITEKERRNLASDIHDTVLQDQIVILRKIDEIRSRLSNSTSSIKAHDLAMLKDMVLDGIEQIRETCHLLRPPLLQELGLVGAVEKMLELMRLRVDFDIQFDCDRFSNDLKEEHKLTLYRVIQELLTNASKHAHASKVSLTLATEGDRVSLLYSDNGIGLNMEAVQRSSEQHLGLWGIKERIYSLNGEVHIVSEEGKGLRMHIFFPYKYTVEEEERLLRF